MPVINSEANHLLKIHPFLRPALEEQLSTVCMDFDSTEWSFVHVFLGQNIARTYKDQATWLCKRMRFGYAVTIIQMLPFKLFWRKPGSHRDAKGLCISFLWTSGTPTPEEVIDVLEFGNSIVSALEMLRGEPLPIPLKPLQIPTPFEVATWAAGQFGSKTTKRTVFGGEIGTSIVEIDAPTVELVGTVNGVLGPIEEIFDSRLKVSLHTSAQWQRKAIRAAGLEEWTEVVVCSNVFLETFAVQLAIQIKELKCQPILDVQAALKSGLHAFINKNLGSEYLKGRWDQTRYDTPFGRWYKDCHLLRHKIVHEGYFPSGAEARLAFQGANQLAKHISKLASELIDPDLSEVAEHFKSYRTP